MKIKVKLSNLQNKVYKPITKRGKTTAEVAYLLGLPMHSVSGRITELKDLRLIGDSNNKRVNPASGKEITVWRKLK